MSSELRRRVLDESGLGEPVPYVSVEIAQLLTDLLLALEAAEAVVAAQREALRWYADANNYRQDPWGITPILAHDHGIRASRALDAEGVSEPGTGDVSPSGHREQAPEYARVVGPPGSLTSPVDTEAQSKRVREVFESFGYEWLPLDELEEPRGYVEHGPGGPQAVYHAETPDAYLQHGDR